MADGLRHLVIVLGDQLDRGSAAFEGFDEAGDAVWMAEVEEEASHVWAQKRRLVLFFSAMRHFRDELRDRGRTVHYHALTADRREDRGGSFAEVLQRDVRKLRPEKLIVVHPGDQRVKQQLEQAARDLDIELEIRPDDHFYVSLDEFADWAAGRKEYVLEHFYRRLRQRENVLMTADGGPVGGTWNYDEDNRAAFGRDGPPRIKPPRRFQPDAITDEVIDLVEQRWPDRPGSTEQFDLPVTHEQALAALRDFAEHRLPGFGTYEDAMWTDEPFLYHSRLSVPLNLHLLDPRKAVAAASDAYRDGHAALNHVEGFVRQVLGWREFVRGLYWLHQPGYNDRNALDCDDVDVPPFFWDADTDMQCVHQAMTQVVRHGYAHHIQRLMVLGLFAMQFGVHPGRFNDWHLAMYLDAIDWASAPNTIGMSQYGDGGIVGTKPYTASGNYIHRMSNYCRRCRYDPRKATGEDACPISTLYWDFLDRHADRFAGNPRMNFQLQNLNRKDADELRQIRRQAGTIRDHPESL